VPKLTEEEKLARKAALKLKRTAHTARRRTMDARELVLTAERVAPLTTAGTKARALLDEALNARAEYDRRCRVEIETLQQKHAEERAPYETDVSQRATECTAAWSVRNAEEVRVRKQVEEEFPDLVGSARYHVGGWTPPRAAT
jgi:hypothetical protein